MDYKENRDSFLRNYEVFLREIVLNNVLRENVKKDFPTLWESNSISVLKISRNLRDELHPNFLSSVGQIFGALEYSNPTDGAVASYILLELTSRRESCNSIIKLLNDSEEAQNVSIANKIKEYNTSPGRAAFDDRIDIPVTLVDIHSRKDFNSKNYPMTRNPRGKCVIMNLVPDLVKLEHLRFKHIFKTFCFDVEVCVENDGVSLLTTNGIKRKLSQLSDELQEMEEPDEAVMIMIITHGGDEKIMGTDYNNGIDPNDLIHHKDIVDLFSKIDDVVKIFYFICCRNVMDTTTKNTGPFFVIDQHQPNTDAFVHYSCPRGSETKIHPNYNYTRYGKALSESMAQYAHDLDLSGIMSRTYQKLKEDYENHIRHYGSADLGEFTAESQQGGTHKLFFNPGWHDEL